MTFAVDWIFRYGNEALARLEECPPETMIGNTCCTDVSEKDDRLGVTSIGDYAFERCTGLESITIPDSVISIGTNVFYGCSGLTDITVDNRNSSFCSESGVLFNKDKTTLICYPAGKTDSSYKIPDEVTSIGYSAFETCTELKSITIPDSVTSIGYAAFDNCIGLTSIYIPDGIYIVQCAIPSTAAKITYIVNSDGSVTITKIELPEGQNTINIPAAINGKKVTAVSENYQNFVGTHAHVLNKTEAVAHTCTTDGTIEY